MAVKGYYDFNVMVVGSDAGEVVSEERKVRFTMFNLIRSGVDPNNRESFARNGTLDLVREAHPTWTDLTVTSAIEV